MPFALDRDLLAACPDLLSDVTWAGQTTLDVTNATLSGGTLTMTSGSFTDSGVQAGSVLLVDAQPREVLDVASSTSCTTSLVRADADASAIPGPDASAAAVSCRTFAPQREAACQAVLLNLGIDPDRDGAQDLIDGIVSLELMRRLEVLRALESIYATAPGTADQVARWQQQAAFYRGRFAEVFFHARVQFDLDGDGIAEQERALNVVPTYRV